MITPNIVLNVSGNFIKKVKCIKIDGKSSLKKGKPGAFFTGIIYSSNKKNTPVPGVRISSQIIKLVFAGSKKEFSINMKNTGNFCRYNSNFSHVVEKVASSTNAKVTYRRTLCCFRLKQCGFYKDFTKSFFLI